MIRAHKIRLHPTPAQANYFARAAGTARFVWNWALAEWNRQYAAGEKPTALKLKKQFNEIRRAQFPWTWDVTKNASDQPFLDLSKAFTDFFEGLKTGKRKGLPKFKSKKRSKPSFYLSNDQFELGELKIWIPKLGWVNMAENLRFKGKIKGARITKTADWWVRHVGASEIPTTSGKGRSNTLGSRDLPNIERWRGQQHVTNAQVRLKTLRTQAVQDPHDMVKLDLLNSSSQRSNRRPPDRTAYKCRAIGMHLAQPPDEMISFKETNENLSHASNVSLA